MDLIPPVKSSVYSPKTTTHIWAQSLRGQSIAYKQVFVLAALLLSWWSTTIYAQSSTCAAGFVDNGPMDPWSEECYLNDQCNLAGNPCSSTDVTLIEVYLGNSNGTPMPSCNQGSTVVVYLWGKIKNNAAVNRYAIRTRIELWRNGIFSSEFNTCASDGLVPNGTATVLFGAVYYTCGETLSTFNTYIAWSPTPAQCNNLNGPGYASQCSDYSPARCFKDLELHPISPITAPACPLVIVCPPTDGGTFQCISDIPAANTAIVVVVDSCGPVTRSFTQSSTGTGCGVDTFRLTRIYSISDGVTIQTCTQLFKSADTQGPVVTCPANVTIQCNTDTSPAATGSATAADNCGPVIALTFSDVTSAGLCDQEFNIVRTWTAIDACGNTSSCSQNIFVDDNTPPAITCPDNITIECDASTSTDDTGLATAVDICDPNPTVTFFDYTNFPPAASPEFRWEFFPPGAVSGSCVSGTNCQTGTVCFVLQYTPGVTGTLTSYTTGFFIDCFNGGSPIASNLSCVMTDNSGEIPDCGVTGLILMNSSGNTGSLAVTQNVPVILHQICLNIGNTGNISIEEDETSDLTASIDLPGGGTVTESPAFNDYNFDFNLVCNDVCPYPGTIYRQFIASDDCGNESVCVQQITLTDTTPPVITCPANVTAQCNASTAPTATGFATAVDNCDANPTVTYSDITVGSTVCPLEINITRRWLATDDCGNTSTCIQTISVDDNLPPVITCPPNLTLECTDSTAPGGTNGTATATDNCDATPTVTFIQEIIRGTCQDEYSLIRTWIATDDCGNSATCTQTFSIQDNTPPVITSCPANLTIQCSSSTAPGGVNGMATATDNCDSAVTISSSDAIAGGTCPQEFIITRTWSANDNCGNFTTCVQIIEVQDNLPPAITCPPAVTVECNVAGPGGQTGVATATDNCDTSPTITSSDVIAEGACPQEFTISRTWIASDDCGNSSSCTQQITVQDNTPPVITCPVSVTVECNTSLDPTVTGTATASDLCDPLVIPTFSDVTASTGCSQAAVIIRTWTVMDDCGNTNICTQVITVQDTTPPSFLPACQLVFDFNTSTPGVACPADATISLVVGQIVGESEGWSAGNVAIPSLNGCLTDNCTNPDSLVARVDSILITGNSCDRTFTVFFTIIDECGNESVTQFVCIVNIHDDVAPVITCPPSATVDCNTGTSPTATGVATATDDCQDAPTITFADVTAAGQCPQEFTITRTWTADDGCGNSSTCAQIINVQDTIPPSFVVGCQLVFDFNTSVPGTACPAVATITLTEGQIVGEAQGWVAGGVAIPSLNGCLLDNCTNPDSLLARVDSIATVRTSCDVSFTVFFTIIDQCGNESVDQFICVVNIHDNVPPVLTCPASVTIDCNVSTSPDSTGVATATDDCQSTITITSTDVTVAGNCPQAYTITRTWIADDGCDNISTCTQVISVQDIIPPSFLPACQLVFDFNTSTPGVACPADATISLVVGQIVGESEGWSAGNVAIPSLNGCLTDNCTNPDSLVARVDSIAITGNSCDRTFTVFFTIIDQCGNESVDQFVCVVNIHDDVAPVITCPANVTVNCDGDSSPDSAGSASATDDCQDEPILTFTDVTVAGTCPQELTITRTWTADDGCDNTSTCVQTIFVQDTVPPTFNPGCQLVFDFNTSTPGVACPAVATITLVVGQIVGEADGWFAGGVAIPSLNGCLFDNCTNADSLVARVDSIATIRTSCDVSFTVFFTIIDQCGNESVDQFICVVNLHDDVAPVITCPASVTIDCDDDSSPVATGVATATDDCQSTITITSTDITVAGNCPQAYTITRTWSADDGCDNISTCTQIITVQDTTPPTASPACSVELDFYTSEGSTCPFESSVSIFINIAQGIPIGVDEIWFVGNNAVPTLAGCLADNCSNPDSLHVQPTSLQVTGDSCDATFTIELTISDECGNTNPVPVVYIIHIHDDVPPVITCPIDVTIECGTDTTPGVTGVATAIDECRLDILITFSDSIIGGACPQEFSILRTWIADDNCGNTSTCIQAITVQDTIPPTFNPGCQLVFDFNTSSQGVACPAVATITLVEGQIVGEADGWFAGGVAIPSLNGCLFDNCTNPDSLRARVDSIATVRTNCDVSFTVFFTILDQCGNESVDQFICVVNIHDDVAPVITCPASVTIDCDADSSPASTGVATATDDCQSAITFTSNDVTTASDCPGAFTIIRTWSADDGCDNISTCTQVILVQDTTPPSFIPACQLVFDFFTSIPGIDCPAEATMSLVVGQIVGESQGWTAGGASIPSLNGCLLDNCTNPDSLVARVDSISITGDSCIRTFTVFFTIIDQCGNESVDQFICVVNIHDNVAPTLTCPPNLTLSCSADTSPDSTGVATATDDCQTSLTIFYTEFVIPGACPQNFIINRTWNAEDGCGNTSTCLQIITVQDVIPPDFIRACQPTIDLYTSSDTIQCPANSTISLVVGQIIGEDETWTVGGATMPSLNGCLTDNCTSADSIVARVEAIIITGTGCDRSYVVFLRILDQCGNGSAALFQYHINIHDDVAPVLTCPPDVSVDCGGSILPDSLGVATATDDCQINIIVTSSDSVAIGGCPQEYIIYRTWSADDGCDNISTCVQAITVQDTTAPTFNPACQLVFDFYTSMEGVDCPADATISLVVGQIVGESEAWFAGGQSIPSLNGCLFDNCTNPDSLVARVDSIAITGDNCTRTFTVFFTIIDQCDNESDAQFVCVVNIHDNVAPNLVCPADIVVDCNSSSLPINTGVATVSDDCQFDILATYTDSVTVGSCPQELTIQRTWFSEDGCGNSSSCVQTIMVQDTTPPTFLPACQLVFDFNTSTPGVDCPAEAEISLVVGQIVGESEGWSVGGVSIPSLNGCLLDNCTNPDSLVARVDSIDISGTTCDRTFVVFFTIIDQCGNESVNPFICQVNIHDDVAPVITCPADTIIDCEVLTTPDVTGTATATDDCQSTITITSFDEVAQGQCPQNIIITRTWSADDGCDNVSTCVQIITVQDTTPPSFLPACQLVFDFNTSTQGVDCPAEAVISLVVGQIVGESEGWSVGGVTIPSLNGCLTDNCTNPDSLVARVDSIDISGNTCDRTFVVFFTIIDQCGNESVDQFICQVNIHDDVAPLITCPADTVIDCQVLPIPANTGTATATDDCQEVITITSSDEVALGQCPQEMTITRTWTADDGCDNVSTCIQIITVQDTLAPVITCPVNLTVQCNTSTAPAVTGSATATDNCDLSVIPTFSDVTVGGACPQELTITRTWTAIDDCGNSTTCAQIIFVDDSTPPVITCPVNLTVQCNTSTAPAVTGSATATDNCDLSVIPSFSDVTVGGACPQELTITRTWTAVDDCGNSSTCAQIIFVDDSTPPVITCPVNLTVQCNTNTTPEVTGTATATDNCDVSVIPTFSDVTVGGACPQELTITRTWTAIDDCGNSSTCAQIIFVDDSTPPVITCPVNLTVQCNTSTAPAVTGSATATDNCDVSVIPAFSDVTVGGACPQELTITRTWTAIDDCGNSSTCAQVIFVDDSTPPVITCPANLSIECSAVTLPSNTGSATATDNCDVSVIPTFSDVTVAGSCPQEYTITRTWRAIDDCGNSSSCVQTILVDDTTPPSITCPPDVTVSCQQDIPPLNPGLVITSDNCSPVIGVMHVVDFFSNQICLNRFHIDRVYRATDQCGNSATCIQSITIFDGTPPTMTCPPPVTVQCATDVPPSNIALVTATDNCSGGAPVITFVGDVISNMVCANQFIVTRVYRATDICGNSATCAQIITVFDNTPPTLTCPPGLTVTCASDVPPANVQLVTATDNCAGAAAGPVITFVSDVNTNVICANQLTVIRTYRATDICGNSATCTQSITVFDNVPPSITCPASVTVQCASDVPAPSTTAVIASDNCAGLVTITFVSDVNSNVVCTNRFLVTRTFRATDVCGNSATCTQLITVFDNIPPVITCPANLTIECTASTLPGGTNGTATATDNCAGTVSITSSDVTVAGGCPQEYTITRTWSAIDVCGNSVTCGQIIFVDDSTPPVLTCPVSITVQCATDVPPANTQSVTATDNCGTTTVTFVGDVTSNFTCTNRFLVTRTYSATDQCGNSATCTQLITVFDNTPPTLTCPPSVTVQCATDVPPANVQLVTATDNCTGGEGQIPVITLDSDITTNVTCTNRFVVNRVYRATDVCGNTATCIQVITVFDNTPPTLTCPAGLTVQCATDVPAANPALVISSDNCAGVVTNTLVSDVITNMTCANRFLVTRTYRATDVCGNSATCTQVITVFDNTPPMITCPAAVTVQCASLVPAPNTATVIAGDNCGGGTPIVTFISDVTVNQTCVNRFTLNRTYQAADVCGNTATCLQVITVFDNTAPSITCPAAVTVQCASQVPAVNIGSVVTSDNCTGPAPVVTFVSDVTVNQTCVNRYTLNRTYRSTDACGNSATCVQVITVFDNTAPTLTCPAPVTVQCASQVPVPNPAGIPAADNCNGVPVVTFVSDVISNQTCVNRFIVTRTYRATDECGNSATCTQVITVFDNIPPVITFTNPLLVGTPNNGTIEVQCFGQDPEWDLPVFGPNDVNAVDNCAGAVTVTFDDVLIDEGNCPVDGYINRYRLRWVATDACGNSSSLTVFLNLVDTIPPVILGVPEDITVNCDEVPEAPTLTATDECLCACVVELTQQGPLPGCQNGQVIIRTWEATDYCGNVTIEQQHITLVDEEGPVLTIEHPELAGLPDGTLIEYTCNEGGIPDFYDDLNAESVSSPYVCGGLPKITFHPHTIISRNCKRFGYIEERTFQWIGVDACGNTTSLTITVHLIDDEAPVIVGVPDIACSDDPALKEIEAIDNCDKAGLIFWDVEIPNPCGDGPAYRRTYEAVDPCGNYARDTVIIIPNDNVPPVLIFTNKDLEGLGNGEFISVNCDETDGYLTPWGLDDVSVSDDCVGVDVEFDQMHMQDYPTCEEGTLSWLKLTWTATDLCGNSSSLFLFVYVIDETAPAFDPFPIEATIGCNDEWPVISATDNCATVVITEADSIINKTCEFEYDVIRTLTATDPCGNTTVRKQLLHVGDHSGPDITGVVEELCNDLSIPNVNAWDPCAEEYVPVSLQETTLSLPCPGGFVIERTWSATDLCGNTAQVVQHIIMNDTIPPVIQVPSWSIIRKFVDNIGNFVNLSDTHIMDQLTNLDESSIFVEDGCDIWIIPVFTLDITYADNCATDGYYERRVYTWTATDACGNVAVLTFTVDIMDDIAPVFADIPADITVICGPLPAPAVVHASDYGPVTITYKEVIGNDTEFGHYIVRRIWTATDACGNVTVAEQQILWIPDTFVDCEILLPSGVECNSHGVPIGSDVEGGIGPFIYEWEVVGQECFIQGGQSSPDISIYVGFFEVQINLTVTDAFGCSSVCSATLECLDFLDDFVGNPGNGAVVTPVTPAPVNVISSTTEDYLQQLSYWPNPANNTLNVSFESAIEGDVEISFVNFLGETVMTDHMNARQGVNTRKLDVTTLPEGAYLLQVTRDKEVHAKGIVIMR